MRVFKFLLLIILLFLGFNFARFVFFPKLDALIYAWRYPNQKPKTVATNRAECLKQKGDWGRAGIYPQEICRIPAKDAGKFCFAGSMCEYGSCLAQLNLRRPAIFASGICARYRQTFGCFQNVHFGLTDSGICRD